MDRPKPGRCAETDGTPYANGSARNPGLDHQPQLRNVPGVTEINTIGGYAKGITRSRSPDKLVAHGLEPGGHRAGAGRNNGNVGAGYIRAPGKQYLIRAPGQLAGIEDIADIVVGNAQARPIGCATWPT